MNRKKKICLLSLCMIFLFLTVVSVSVGDTFARYTTQFSGIVSYSAGSIPSFKVNDESVVSSHSLKPDADAWTSLGGEKIYSFDVSATDSARNTQLRVRVFVEEDESATMPTVALTMDDTRYTSQFDYLGQNTPFYLLHKTEGWYYCFTLENEEILCFLNGNESKTLTVSVHNTEIDLSRIWICIDRVSA
ncbi:MAG: hypothetical protein J6C26_04105 [Clostridia bacterium]|nr:hypothetical protein [Clostridia bacterium]